MKIEDKLIQEKRIKYIQEKIDFYFKEIYDFCERNGFSHTGTHYWHIVVNKVTCIQGGLAKFRRHGNLESLSSAEQHIKDLETYFSLLEKFPDYLKGEAQSKGSAKNYAFPEFTGNDVDYICKSKQRLESENKKCHQK